jgi:hypothetical protein
MVYVMTMNKLLHHTLLITAFVYLLMCPSAHALSDTTRHDVICKVVTKTLQKDFKGGVNVTTLHLPNNTRNDIFGQSKDTQKLLIISPPYSTLNLTILSTVRLIL